MPVAGDDSDLSGIPEVVRQVSRVWLPLGQQITNIGAELARPQSGGGRAALQPENPEP